MKRTAFCAAVMTLIGGCQFDGQSGAPANLPTRLASVERARLAMVAVEESDGDSPAVRRERPMGPESAQVGLGGDIREWSAGHDEALTLSDLGDQPGDSTTIKSQSSSPAEGASHKPPLPSLWDTIKRDVKDMPCDLWRDTKRVYANPVNLAILGAAYGGSLALQESGPDGTIEHHYNTNNDFHAPRHSFSSGWRDAFGAIGNPGTHFALAGVWYLVGQQTQCEKPYEVGKTLFSALIINDLTVVLGQTASWDKSPNGEWGTFPSGHTSSAFVVASVMHEAYGHAVGVPLYALATLVGVERLDDREHYFSDVCMGAVLGTVIGHSVASGRDPEFFGWKLLPYVSPEGGSGLAVMKTMK